VNRWIFPITYPYPCTKLIVEKAMHENVPPKIAAQAISQERVMDAMKYRGY